MKLDLINMDFFTSQWWNWYNGAKSYLFVNVIEIYKFKAKYSETVGTPLCLGNISKDWSIDDLKKTGLNVFVYDFNVDYDAITITDILVIHEDLMTKIVGQYKMFRFVKQIFVSAMMLFSCNLSKVNPLKCVSMSNQQCKVSAEINNVNSNEPLFYICSVKINKCSTSCNDINDPLAKLCVPDVVKSINLKLFNLMSRKNETRYIKLHETCKCKCRVDASVCSNKQRWNGDKCKC